MQPTANTTTQRRAFGRSRRGVVWTVAAVAFLVLAPGGVATVPAETGKTAETASFAALHYEPVPGKVAENRARATRLIAAAAKGGARYIVLPELGIHGRLDDLSGPQVGAEAIPGPTSQHFADLAQEFGVWIALSLAEDGGDRPGHYVTTLLLDPRGDVRHHFRKVMPRIDGSDGELIRGEPRVLLDTVDTGERRIGVAAGDDLLTAIPRLSDRGADTVLVSAAWGVDEPVKWRRQVAMLSERYGVRMVIANRSAAGGDIYSRQGEPVGASRATTGGRMTTAAFAPSSHWRPATQLGLPSVPVPSGRPASPEIAEIGRELFFDKNLSRDGSISCGTCHLPEKAFANGQPSGVGITGQNTARNVPSLLNVAYKGALFWDGFTHSLENQAKYPMSHAMEMDRSQVYHQVLGYVRWEAKYVKAFRAAMGVERIEFEHVETALATYQRTLLSGNSPFDRYYYQGDEQALSVSAQRGLDLFRGKAGCVQCHTMGQDYALFLDNEYHNTGVGYDPKTGEFSDSGVALISHEERTGLFLTPSLRHVAETAPYMHDGSFTSLTEVVEFYNRGGNDNPYQDSRLEPLGLKPQERRDLVAFLKSLTGEPQGQVRRASLSEVRNEESVSEESDPGEKQLFEKGVRE